jgi:hypothetical protein
MGKYAPVNCRELLALLPQSFPVNMVLEGLGPFNFAIGFPHLKSGKLRKKSENVDGSRGTSVTNS